MRPASSSASAAVLLVGALLGAPCVAAPSPTGGILGHVTVSGTIPGNPIIRMGLDPKCAEGHRGERVLQAGVVATPDGSLANVFVVLQGTFPRIAVPAQPVIVDQRGCLYQPRVVGMRVGQTLQVRNDDDLLHNVHGSSAAGNSFNVGQPKAGLVFDFVPHAPEVMLKLGCDVHSWMVTYVGVVEHPYFAVTDGQGSFNIGSVPPGTYQIRFWHERFGQVSQAVTVRPGAVATVDFAFVQTGAGARPR